jgi:hypothetical protein
VDPALAAGSPARQLLAALRGEGVAASDWEAVIALALRQGVAPLLHRRIQAAGTLATLPAGLAAQLEEERRATALVSLRHYAEFQRVARALGEAGIPLIALKGLHLAELVYRDIGLRPMSDLDILVPREHVADCLRLLLQLGFGSDADPEAAVARTLDIKCNIGVENPAHGTWLEVHWRLDEGVADAGVLLPAIWKSAGAARLGDADAKVMAPEFLLLHVCAHLACNHAFLFSLRGLCDIAEILNVHPDLDWKVVVEHGLRHGWTRGVAASLRLARDHLGAPVPAEVLNALGGDALEPAMLAEAMTQLLGTTVLPGGLVTAPNLLALSGAKGWGEKLGLLWKRIFLPRAELALLYGVPADSPRLPLFYALRLRDLLSRYASGAWALNAGDPALAEVAARHTRLTRWLRNK